MNEKLNKLENLNKILKPPPLELGGKFLPEGSSKQYDFMFVAEKPSMNIPKDWDGKSNYNFDVTKRDKFFQTMMVKYGVDGNYATDIVKERGRPGKPAKAEIQEWLPFLRKEIEIIQPKVIIVVGERTYNESFKPFVKSSIPKDIKVDWVYHYRQQGSKTDVEVEQRFGEVINRMRYSN
ncbi:hypothetical protein KJ590_03595 [Patescibacteria group bacterium]|nr:hypothetical protein [Patescibacteria group bacterium]MBU4143053.1 hypothetical protein [Patescibacteria group bacterium]